jgi:CTP synthase
VKSIYDVPLSYHAEGFDDEVCRHFGLLDNFPGPDLSVWNSISQTIAKPEGSVKIAIVGKYTSLLDSYKSLAEALTHGGIANNIKVEIDWIDAEIFEKENPVPYLEGVDGILVPGGFGERGAEGKISAVKFARERKVPFLGICFGMQMAVIEAARNLSGIEGAGSTEFGSCDQPVVGLLTEWARGSITEERGDLDDLGGTMRLGAYECDLLKNSKAHRVYGSDRISERHRHRYEVNIDYKDRLEMAGLTFSGMSPDNKLPEIVEIPDHPWFVGVQFHPELKSKPFDPHPLFEHFINAAMHQSRLV